MSNENISNGTFLVARKIFNSELWLNKPSSWKVIFIYILGKVNWKDTGSLSRGEGFFNFSIERQQIGTDVSADAIKKFLKYARNASIVSTTKSTRGMFIKVLKYDVYQNFDNFGAPRKAPREALQEHYRSTTIYEEGKNNNKKFNKKDFYSNLPLL